MRGAAEGGWSALRDAWVFLTVLGLIGAGVGLGGALFALGLSTPELVTSPEETVRLAADDDRGLATPKNKGEGARLRRVPALAPGYAGLSARLTF